MMSITIQTNASKSYPEILLNNSVESIPLLDLCEKRLNSYEKGVRALLANLKRSGLSDGTVCELTRKITRHFQLARDKIHSLADAKENQSSKCKKIIQVCLFKTEVTLKKEMKLVNVVKLINVFENLEVQKEKMLSVHTPLSETKTWDGLGDVTLRADRVHQTNISLKKEWNRIEKASPPAWFLELPRVVQQEYQHYLTVSGKADSSVLINGRSSSLRDGPALSNLKSHTLEIVKESEKLVSLESFSHSVIVPIDVRDKHAKFWLTLLNLSQVVQLAMQKKQGAISVEKPLVILLQTLISPGPASVFLNQETHYYQMKQEVIALFEYALKHPDNTIQEDFLKAQIRAHGAQDRSITYRTLLEVLGFKVKKSGILLDTEDTPFRIELFATNHPLNSLGRLNKFLYKVWFSKAPYKQHNQNTQARLIGKVRAFLENPTDSKTNDFVENLLKSYELTLNHLSYKGRRKSLHLASLEEILIYATGGVVTGSCKSGKDRFGIKTMYSQTMVLYWHRYNKVFSYYASEEEVAQFNEIYSTLYRSGHHQICAESNAPGARGIKNPIDFLPSTTSNSIKALEPTRLKQDHQLAELNKIYSLMPWSLLWMKLSKLVHRLFSSSKTDTAYPQSNPDLKPLYRQKILQIDENLNQVSSVLPMPILNDSIEDFNTAEILAPKR